MPESAPAPAQANTPAPPTPVETSATSTQPNAITPQAAAPVTQAPAAEAPKPVETPAAPQPITLEVPKDSLLTADDAKALADFATKAGFKPEVAKELLAGQGKLLADYQARQQQAHVAQVEAWDKSLAEDKEIGGQNLKPNLEAGRRALEKYGSELIPFLRESGFNSHPDVVRFIVRIGKAMSEDRIAPGSDAQAPRDLAEAMFGNRFQKS